MAKLKVIGTSIPRVDALDKVTGQAKYATDFRLPHMLHGKLVRSPYPHARILRIDISKAQKLSGVKVIATSDNTPPISVGMMLNDRHAFPIDGKVRYTGDVVAAIACDDLAEAKAIESALGEETKRIAVWPAKSMLSNTGAASGALDVIAAVCAMSQAKILAAKNCDKKANGCNLNIIKEPMEKEIRYVLCCSYTYGGQTAAIILKNADS